MAAPDERYILTDISESEFDTMVPTSKYVVIPPGKTGIEQEGDSIYLEVEAGVATDKTAGKSLSVPLTVVEEGINYGKIVEWWPGISEKQAVNITKTQLKVFSLNGVKDITARVIVRQGGKIGWKHTGFAGTRARARFVRERATQGKMSLRSILDSASFLPVLTVGEGQEKNIGI